MKKIVSLLLILSGLNGVYADTPRFFIDNTLFSLANALFVSRPLEDI